MWKTSRNAKMALENLPWLDRLPVGLTTNEINSIFSEIHLSSTFCSKKRSPIRLNVRLPSRLIFSIKKTLIYKNIYICLQIQRIKDISFKLMFVYQYVYKKIKKVLLRIECLVGSQNHLVHVTQNNDVWKWDENFQFCQFFKFNSYEDI